MRVSAYFFTDVEGITRQFHAKDVRRYVHRDPEARTDDTLVPKVPHGSPLPPSLPSTPEIAPVVPDPAEEEDLEEPVLKKGHFIINTILGARGTVGRNRCYRVSWEGYGPDENTWQPENSLPKSTIDTFVKKNRVPRDLRPDELTFKVDAEEILQVVKLSSMRMGKRKEARVVHVILVGDSDSQPMKMDIEHLPKGILSDPSRFEDEDLHKRILASVNRHCK